jgi:hypothetical protein
MYGIRAGATNGDSDGKGQTTEQTTVKVKAVGPNIGYLLYGKL